MLGASAAQAVALIPVTITTEKAPVTLTLELATTEAARMKGLMHRTSLAPHDGMLFQFREARHQSFWMKDTPLPLDIIFIGVDGRVARIAHHTTPYDATPILSGVPVYTVIEIAGGRAKTLGIRSGLPVKFQLPEDIYVE